MSSTDQAIITRKRLYYRLIMIELNSVKKQIKQILGEESAKYSSVLGVINSLQPGIAERLLAAEKYLDSRTDKSQLS